MPILNHGGTCYAASVLHSLASIDSFVDCLEYESDGLTKSFNDTTATTTTTTSNTAGDHGDYVALVKELACVVSQVRRQLRYLARPGPSSPGGSGADAPGVLSIRNLLGLFRVHHPRFFPFEQNDAQEFLTLLIDALARKRIVFREDDGTPDASSRPSSSQCVQSMHGQTCHATRCPECGDKAVTKETFCTLQLYFDGGAAASPQTLEEAICSTLRATMTLPSFVCDKCTKKTSEAVVLRTSCAWRLPRVLVVVLVCPGNRPFNAAPMTMDLTGTLAPESPFMQQSYRYRLRSMVNHYGSTLGGHYTSVTNLGFSDDPTTVGAWAVLDDERSHIENMHPDTVQVPCPSSYMLFYERLPPFY